MKRFDFRGSDTMHWVVQRHGAIAGLFGISLCAVWLILRRSGGEKRALRPLTVTIGLVALQGALGIVQYAAKLPGELVWVHVLLACGTWLAAIWAACAAGSLVARRVAIAPELPPSAPLRAREAVESPGN